MDLPLFLGVDGGQSHTRAAVGDASGRVVGRAEAGPANHAGAAEGERKLRRAVSEAVGGAVRAAGADAASVRFQAACFGLSGGPAGKREILAEIVSSEKLETTTDARIALAGGTGGEPGIVVIAGTGSMAFGENASGKTARAGGWGYVFGDEGGAFDLVRQALRAALRWEEGWGPPTALHGMLLAECGSADANELMHRFYGDEFPRARIAALASLVDRAARGGDQPAAEILDRAGSRLAELALAVHGNLFADEGNDANEETAPGSCEEIGTATSAGGTLSDSQGLRIGAAGCPSIFSQLPVVKVGGVFDNERVSEAFRREVERRGDAAVTEPRFEPVIGALIRAYRMAGKDVVPRID